MLKQVVGLFAAFALATVTPAVAFGAEQADGGGAFVPDASPGCSGGGAAAKPKGARHARHAHKLAAKGAAQTPAQKPAQKVLAQGAVKKSGAHHPVQHLALASAPRADGNGCKFHIQAAQVPPAPAPAEKSPVVPVVAVATVPGEPVSQWVCDGQATELDADGRVTSSAQVCRKNQDVPRDQRLSHFDSKWSCGVEHPDGVTETVCRLSRPAVALVPPAATVDHGGGSLLLPAVGVAGVVGVVVAVSSHKTATVSP